MAALLHFEEKVHKRRLARAASIHLLFPRLLCHVLAHMGFPADPHSEPRRHCRESFSLDQWNQVCPLLRPLQLPRSCLARFFPDSTTTRKAIMEQMDHFQLQQDQQTLILREIQQTSIFATSSTAVPSSIPSRGPSYPPEKPTT
ncbi:hypothetical protein AAG906_028025 [Vitis piasezkii]